MAHEAVSARNASKELASKIEQSIDQLIAIAEDADQSIATTFQKKQGIVAAYEEHGLSQMKKHTGAMKKKISLAEVYAMNLRSHMKLYGITPASKTNSSFPASDAPCVGLAIAQKFRNLSGMLTKLISVVPPHPLILTLPETIEPDTSVLGELVIVRGGLKPVPFYRYDKKNAQASSKEQSQKLKYPVGMAIHPITHDIYIADSDNHRICVMDSNLNTLKVVGESGRAKGNFRYPRDVGISFDGEVVAVTNRDQNCIHLYDKNLTLTHIIGGSEESRYSFNSPQCIILDEENYIYVSESAGKCVKKLTITGDLVSVFNIKDGMVEPMGMTINDDRELLVISMGGSKVHVFSLDGTHLRDIPIHQLSSGGWNYLARGPSGGFIISDNIPNKITFHSKDGKILQTIDSNGPRGIEVDSNGDLVFASIDCCIYKYLHMDAE